MSTLEYSPSLDGFVPFGTVPTATETVTPTGADDLFVRQTGTFTLPDGTRAASLTIGGGDPGSTPVVVLAPGSVFTADVTIAAGGALQLGPDLASANEDNRAVLTGAVTIDAAAAGMTITAGILAGPVTAAGPLAILGFATFAAPLTLSGTPHITSLAGSHTSFAVDISTTVLQSILQSPGFNGDVSVEATLDNSGATLDLAALSGVSFLNATISGGTLSLDPSSKLSATTLADVTLAGTLYTAPGDLNFLSGTITGGSLEIDGALGFSGTASVVQTDITLGSNALLLGANATSTIFAAGTAIHVSDTAQLFFGAAGAELRFDGTLDLSASVSPYTVSIDANLGSILFGANADISIGANATLKINGALFNSGTIPVIGGTLELVQSGGTLGTLRFAGSDAALRMDVIGQTATLLDFQDGDHLVFPTASTSNVHATLNGNTLDIFSGSNNRLAGHFVLARSDGGTYSAEDFVFGTSGAALSMATSGVAITACYAAGTLIETADGERPIETLAPGDRVRTVAGLLSPILWIGHRTLDLQRHPRPQDVQPVRVAAHAFGSMLPRRDLILSPDHAVFVEGVLIPIRYLVNGATIVQERRGRITYLHLELASHDAVLAEGLPAETYLDTGNRAAFANGGPAMQLHPDFAHRIWDTRAFAPLTTSGETLALVRHALLAQAGVLGHRRTSDPNFRAMPTRGGFLLTSRIRVPAHMDPASDDYRPLGLAVTAITANGQAIALDDPRLEYGWHAPEPGLRWTAGAATIALPPAARLDVEYISGTADYWLAAPVSSASSAVTIAR